MEPNYANATLRLIYQTQQILNPTTYLSLCYTLGVQKTMRQVPAIKKLTIQCM